MVRVTLALLWLMLASAAVSAPRRVLYVTATAGFRHTDSIDASIEVMRQLAQESGVLEIVHTEDLSMIEAGNLRNFGCSHFLHQRRAASLTGRRAMLVFHPPGEGASAAPQRH